MAENNINREQLNRMIDGLSSQLGGSAGKLKEAVNSGSADGLLNSLPPEEAAKVQKLLSDKGAAQKLLGTPQAQMLLRKFLEGKFSEGKK